MASFTSVLLLLAGLVCAICSSALSAPKCGPNETIRECGDPPEGTCAYPFPNRTDHCEPYKCQCKFGYVRDANGECIKVASCPQPTCGPNEYYRECGGRAATCQEPYPESPYPRFCDPAECDCNSDYVRVNGTCIPMEACPHPECPEGEKWSFCSGCEGTCEAPTSNCAGCRQPKCECIPGNVRNKQGKCVPMDKCDPPVCPENEFWTDCGSCDFTCHDPYPLCFAVCQHKCMCGGGLVRNDSGKCIPANQCIYELNPCLKTKCADNEICVSMGSKSGMKALCIETGCLNKFF
ncbi:hypothetical protein QR680_006654 [Steinernema hermaphroditum]|uniref:TIL domain-containing protein n=1 Tax=Steinernema hermaphroditum TaxID=289476 RepID=A0AA39HXP5_9BILA|nr:hypothetical protein QR680_006654 [Steinernema hermaphroditum]